MLEQPDSPTASQTKQQVFDHYLHRLQSEIHAIIASESGYEDRIKSLEHDLSVFKQACFSAEDEKRILNEEIATLRERMSIVMKNSGKRIVCVIDGNSTLIATDLLAAGRDGGSHAAKLLSDSITYHVPCSVNPSDIWVYLFFNKESLINDLSSTSDEDAINNLDEFIAGFNEFGAHFLMLDVGNGTDTVDAKVKAFVEDHTYSQETSKLLFGGCHDDRYGPFLRTLYGAGLRDKLVLLPGHSELSPEIQTLHIPHLVIPELFAREPLNATGHHQACPAGSRCAHTSMSSSSTSHHRDFDRPTTLSLPPGLMTHQSTTLSSSSSVDSSTQTGVSTTPPPPYQGTPDEHPSPPSPPSNPSSDESDVDESSPLASSVSSFEAIHVRKRGISISDRHSLTCHGTLQSKYESPFYPPRPITEPFTLINPNGTRNLRRSNSRPRRINPNIPLSQHDPPPCTLYYLASNGCKHGAECRFGHDYELTEDDYDIVRNAAKKVPCPTANRGELCIFGEQCCYGHACPFASKCHYMRNGKCKFAGPNMHREGTM